MSPLERASLAIGAAIIQKASETDHRPDIITGDDCRDLAHAVFQSIREPSAAMLIAASGAPGKPTNAVASGLWVRMVDALTEQEA